MSSVRTQSPLIKRAKQEAVFLSTSLMDRCVDATVAELEQAEQRSKSVAQRMQLSDAAQALARVRGELRTAVPAQFERTIDQALDSASETAVRGPRTPMAEDDLALLEDAEVARFVEASRLQQAALPVVEEQLTRLDSLMSSAMGLPVVRADLNPLRPDVLCSALLAVIDRQPTEQALRAHWVRYLARPFAAELKRLYEGVVKLLEGEGVEEARYRLKLTEGGGGSYGGGGGAAAGAAGGNGPANGAGSGLAGGGSRGNGGATGGGAGQAAGGGGSDGGDGPMVGAEMASDQQQLQARRNLFPNMGELAQARPAVSQRLMRDFLYRPQWVAEYDEPLSDGYYQAVQAQIQSLAAQPAAVYDAATAARTRARARQLSVVDRPAREVAPELPLPPEQWGDVASPQERTRTLMDLKSRASKISQVLGLDAVRTLVAQVAGDERVLAPVREAFVALEPALLRLAMSDPRFFGDEQHAARRFIEAVAQRSFKYNDEFSEEFEDFMAPVRDAVRELDALPEATEADFAERLQAFETRWQQQDALDEDGKARGLRSMQFAQQRQELADKVAWEFSLRSDLDGVPQVVADFLFQDWSLVIAHAQLTDERGQLDPGGYLAVVSDLLWSVKRDATLRDPARLFEIVPGLLRALRRGLHMLGKDPQDTEPFFDTLMRLHNPVLRLRRLRSARDAEETGFSRPLPEAELLPDEIEPIPLERPKPKAAEQPWLGHHERLAAGFDADAAESGGAPLSTGAELEDPEDTGLQTSYTVLGRLGEVVDAGFAATLPGEGADAAADGALAGADSFPVAEHTPPAAGAAQGFVPIDRTEAAGEGAAAAAARLVAPHRLHAESTDEAEARTRAQLARLRVGDWADLKVRGQWRRAQLQWTSDNGALFMFISRGGRPHSMTRRTCEKLLRARHLRPVDAGAVVDKALHELREDEAPTSLNASLA